MTDQKFDLSQLLPDVDLLWPGNWEWTTSVGLSALIISILIGMALFFLTQSAIQFIRAHLHVRFYRELIKNLSTDELQEQRQALKTKALKHKKYGKLWREFDESLVLISQKQRLCNTLDAEHFFNTYTLAYGLIENRLLAAVPGFLTAIGVIGTFVGLQLGLGPLGELDPAQAKTDELTQGIFGMIAGASIAFMTSVWGLVTSLLFNFIEKLMERSIRRTITSFQNKMDYLYPCITAEQSLCNIEDFTRQSNDRLAGLDEKIGHKMQEAMCEASSIISDSMTQSLNTILGPAIAQLVSNAHSGSEKALETLLERFLQGVGSAGDNQRIMMEQAAQNISTASSSMTAGLDGFTGNLENQITGMMNKNAEVLNQVGGVISKQLDEQTQRDQARQEQLSSSVGTLVTDMKNQIQHLAEQNATTMKTVQGALSEQLEEQQERESARQQLLGKHMSDIQATQTQVTDSIENILATQQQHNSELLASLHTVIDRFDKLSHSHENATQSMQMVSTEMKGSANQLGLLSSNLKAALDVFGQKLIVAIEKAESLTDNNIATAELFGSIVSDLGSASNQISKASNTLDEAATKANSGLSAVNDHFNALTTTLKEHVAALNQQVSELLTQYCERVQSQTTNRLSTWNEQTNKYTSVMIEATKVLSGVVDEIDGKLSSRKGGSSR